MESLLAPRKQLTDVRDMVATKAAACLEAERLDAARCT